MPTYNQIETFFDNIWYSHEASDILTFEVRRVVFNYWIDKLILFETEDTASIYKWLDIAYTKYSKYDKDEEELLDEFS